MRMYQEFIHKSRYARWIETVQRRENWNETVDRYLEFFKGSVNYDFSDIKNQLETSIKTMEVMPSMRALFTAGDALRRDNTAAYNCSYIAIDDTRSFKEIMHILMCGTGVGFSVERVYVEKLPMIYNTMEHVNDIIIVEDSKEGWSNSLDDLINMLYNGKIPTFDVSRVRPCGARLVTFGGRSSGPDPLVKLFNFIIKIFKNRVGKKLTSLNVHDIVCKIGEVIVVGGVRRSATISLSNLSDNRMALAKSGQWYIDEPQRALANNSVCYTEKPDVGCFLREWSNLYDSKSGERGIFNRLAAQKQARSTNRRDADRDFGTNPCSEIILRPNQFCNLTEVIIRDTDTEETLMEKVKVATILGTFQSTLTYFPNLRKIWKENSEEERLLGVSLTGICDNRLTNGSLGFDKLGDVLCRLREHAVAVNKEYAKKLNIQQSTSITCVKPSGTVSQLADCSSGIHARHSKYYIRSVRSDNHDPITDMLKSCNIPNEPCVMNPRKTTVFSFPTKSPEGCKTRDDSTAIEQLDLWLLYQTKWCEHKPSVTISVKEHEWPEVGAWVWKNFDDVSGVSFLPHSDHIYKQAPYQECSELEYQTMKDKLPKSIDWKKLSDFEKSDFTQLTKEMACVGNHCEL